MPDEAIVEAFEQLRERLQHTCKWSRNLLLKEETDKPTHLNNIHH